MGIQMKEPRSQSRVGKQQLQQIMGHSSVNTTMIYLHISEVPYFKPFSPLDKWEKE